MQAFDKEQALARYRELWEKRGNAFLALPDVERRADRGDYDFTSSVDTDLLLLEQEVQRHGFVLEWDFDDNANDFTYTIRELTLEDVSSFGAKEE